MAYAGFPHCLLAKVVRSEFENAWSFFLGEVGGLDRGPSTQVGVRGSPNFVGSCRPSASWLAGGALPPTAPLQHKVPGVMT